MFLGSEQCLGSERVEKVPYEITIEFGKDTRTRVTSVMGVSGGILKLGRSRSAIRRLFCEFRYTSRQTANRQLCSDARARAMIDHAKRLYPSTVYLTFIKLPGKSIRENSLPRVFLP